VPVLRRMNPARREEVLERLRAFLRGMAERLPVEEVWLFGSLARGEVHEGSDIDLLVIGDFRERFPYRAGPLLRMTDLPIQPFCYTREELEQMKQEGNPFVLTALRTGRRLWPEEE